MKRFSFLYWISLLALAPSAHAVSGAELRAYCADNDKSYSAGFCDGYLRGIGDITQLLDSNTDASPSGICTLGRVTLSEVRRHFLIWAKQHEAELNQSADTQLIRALTAAYPCPGTKPH